MFVARVVVGDQLRKFEDFMRLIALQIQFILKSLINTRLDHTKIPLTW